MPCLSLAGVRVFHSSPAASSLDFIGGPAILLGLISLATDDHTMYAAVKVLHSVLTSNPMCDRLMQHISGYQVTHLGQAQPPRDRDGLLRQRDISCRVTFGWW